MNNPNSLRKNLSSSFKNVIDKGEIKVSTFSLQMEVKKNLNSIKATQGVENVVLTQRDGNPIQYSGIWLSQNEIFTVSAAASAIYNCGLHLHNDNLNYILIEGRKAKILITPLKGYGTETLNKIIDAQHLQGNDDEFFVAITTQPSLNLGGIFLKTRKALADIKKALILSGESFKPPLRQYSTDDIKDLMDVSDHKDENLNKSEDVTKFPDSINLSIENYIELENVLEEYSKNTLDLINSFISIKGGYILASLTKNGQNDEKQLETESCLTYSLFSTANKCSWVLKKMPVISILMDCKDYCQFINHVGEGIFSTKILKGRQKLGLLRLIFPKFSSKIEKCLEEFFNQTKKQLLPDFSEIISEIVI